MSPAAPGRIFTTSATKPKSLESKDQLDQFQITSYWLRTGKPKARPNLSPSQEVWGLYIFLHTPLQWSALEGEEGALTAERGEGSAFEDARKIRYV